MEILSSQCTTIKYIKTIEKNTFCVIIIFVNTKKVM